MLSTSPADDIFACSVGLYCETQWVGLLKTVMTTKPAAKGFERSLDRGSHKLGSNVYTHANNAAQSFKHNRRR